MDAPQQERLAPLRTVFMGTPEFAQVILEHLIKSPLVTLCGVYTQPDRPCGRGQVCQPSAVKFFAEHNDIPVFQPTNFKSQEAIDELVQLAPDLLVVAAYGLILPQKVLDIPKLCALNVHGSLLPKYRGAAPIQRAILNGESSTGITIMQMDAGMDTGDILYARALAIGPEDTAETLHDQLADMGGRMITEAIERLLNHSLVHIKQDDSLATYAAKLEKKEGEILWDQPAEAIHNRIRAMHPWPGAFFYWQGEGSKKPLRLVLSPGKIGEKLSEPKPRPGTFLQVKDGCLAVACADREYLLPALKPSGRKLMDATSFVCGYLHSCF